MHFLFTENIFQKGVDRVFQNAIIIVSTDHGARKKKPHMKQIEVMKATPNNLGTFEMLMLLGHTLHEKNGKDYNVIVDFKSDYVVLVENVK